jgi:hypothetical protein
MIFRQDYLFLGIGAAYGRTIAIAALDNLSRTDALNPCDIVRMFLVGGTQYFTPIWAGRTQKPLIIHTGDHVYELSVSIFLPYLRIEGFKAGRHDDGPYFYFFLLGLLIQIYGIVLTYCFTDTTFTLFKIKTTFVNIGDKGNCLCKVHMDSLIHRYFLIVLIRIFYRAVFHADGTTRALVFPNVPWLFNQRYVEVSCFPFYPVNFAIGQNLDVGMPADLDQLGRQYSHGAVIGREGLVKLGHMAPDARCFLDQVDLKTRSGKVKRGLNTTDPSPNDHDVSKITVSTILKKLFDVFSDRYYVFHVLSPHEI